MGKLAHLAVSYYDGLPTDLRTPQTQLYRGMALVREGGALLARGDVEAANPKLDEARALFEALRAANTKDEQATIGLALTLFTRFSTWGPPVRRAQRKATCSWLRTCCGPSSRRPRVRARRKSSTRTC